MRFDALSAALTGLAAFQQTATAYPGMGNTLKDLRAIEARAPGDSTELIGDLATLDDSQLTTVGRSIKNIIIGSENPQSNDAYGYFNLPPKGSPQCAKDTCCIWKYIANDMASVFRGASGRCTSLARGAVRLGFHDASGWSKATGPLGGADGSLILAQEYLRPENNGLQPIVYQMQQWYGSYQSFGISMADLIQMGATVATVVCPLGPRVRSFVGRKDSAVPAPQGLLPPVTGSAQFLIDMFANKTIGTTGLAALVGAHTTSQQDFVDPARAGDPQDSTPGVWDVLFYKQTLGNAPARVFKFQSDINLSQDPRTAPVFQAFAGNGGQQGWNVAFAKEYVRLSLLGVYNINNLTECTKALPGAGPTSFTASDQSVVDKWVATTGQYPSIVNALKQGNLISGLVNLLGSFLKIFWPW